MVAKLDKVLAFFLYLGLFDLATTFLHKDVTTSGTIGTAITMIAGAAFACSAKPILARYVRYQVFLVMVLLWCFNFYQMTH